MLGSVNEPTTDEPIVTAAEPESMFDESNLAAAETVADQQSMVAGAEPRSETLLAGLRQIAECRQAQQSDLDSVERILNLMTIDLAEISQHLVEGVRVAFEQGSSLAELDRIQPAAKLVLQIAKQSAQLAQATKRAVSAGGRAVVES